MNVMRRARRVLLIGPAALGLVLGCASPYPAVISSTPDKVAIEFEKDGSLEDASKLAQKECGRFGRTADFDVVDVTATPDTRVARFRCVAPESAEAPAPAAASPAKAPAGDDADASEPAPAP
jgi:hypothetical protein